MLQISSMQELKGQGSLAQGANQGSLVTQGLEHTAMLSMTQSLNH